MILEAHPDPKEIEALLRSFHGHRVFDVGGNAGFIAKYLAEKFHEVHSFEPAYESYHHLASIADSNNRIRAYDYALSDMDGITSLFINDGWIERGQLTSFGNGQSRLINCRRLDTVVEAVGPPDFIKIDVEGHEARVVLGALETLVNHHPTLFIEVHNTHIGYQLNTILTPIYGEAPTIHRHPNYEINSEFYMNHYFIILEKGE
jgi:FkbM family methyltransferase